MNSQDADHDTFGSGFMLPPGTVVEQYRIIEKVGAGGMGEVYLAEDIRLDRQVTLKFLGVQYLGNDECILRFKREAQAAARLNHPNIVTIHSVSEYHGRPFFVMEFIDGESLKEILARGAMAPDSVIDFALQIAEALNKAHLAGITHRDIKPSNILIDSDGRAKILDFGLATFAGCEQLTKTGSTLGTIGYMSPEQVRSEPIDARSDLFSLGVVLYEMIAGRLPFRGDIEAALLYAICFEDPEPLNNYAPGTPEALPQIITRLLAKEPARRYQSAADLTSDLVGLRQNTHSRMPAGLAVPTSPQPSIAVLPFHNLSADKEQEYFCEGISEEIVNALTHIDGLRVAARTSAFSFRGKDIDIREIGRRLNVGSVLEGSVRKAGNRVRITAQLVNVADGYHFWSEKFDRDMEDIFAIQDEISLAIVDKLRINLVQEQKARLVKRFTENEEAYNLYLKGRYFWNKRYEGGLYKGLEFFRRAIEKDPTYALAYAGMADCYTILVPYSALAPREAFPQAKAAAQKALELDDTLAEAHTSLAFITMLFDFDWVTSEKEFRRALELNPNYATAHSWYALNLVCRGKMTEAIAEAETAQRLDPLSLPIATYLGLIYSGVGRNQEALALLQKITAVDSNFILGHYYLALSYILEGMYDQAIAEVETAAAITGKGEPVSLHWLAIGYAFAGKSDEARRFLNQALEAAEVKYLSSYYTAYVFAGLGDKEKTLDYLERAYEERDNWLCEIKMDPRFENLWSEPRYQALIQKVGLAD